ncbi:MAG: sulfurtransferase TusA family protein [Gammaproteobacteria bacterium]
MQDSEPDIIEYDIRGQICPSCLLMTLQRINELGGAIKEGLHSMHVLTDNRHATATIPAAVSHMGFDVKVSKDTDYYRIAITALR